MNKKSIAKTLQKQRELIFNSSKPEIASKLAQMGIDSAHLNNGETLYNGVIDLSETQKREKQEGSLAYDIFYDAKSKCKKQMQNQC